MSFNPTYEQLFAKARSQKDSSGDNFLYFKDPTAGQLASSSEFEPTASGLPGASALIGRGLNRAHKVAKQYVDNIPGLAAADKGTSKDPLNEHLMHTALSGGRLGKLGLVLRILNAGATNAGTLDEAKRLGYYKE